MKVRTGAIDNCGLIEAPGQTIDTGPTTQDAPAFSDGADHLALDAVQLTLRADWPHFGFRRQRIANLDLARQGNHPFEKGVGNCFLQQQSRTCHTALPSRPENAGNRAVHGALQIGVVKHDDGRLTAQLQRDLRKIIGGIIENLPRCPRTSGKGYPRHPFV